MKILFVTSEIPYPPDNGVRIVSHHSMRLMHEQGNEIALAVLTDEDEELERRFEIASNGCAPNDAFFMRLPRMSRFLVLARSTLKRRLYFLERYDCTVFRQRLRALVHSFKPDVIHFDLILMTQYRSVTPRGVGTIASINDSHSLMLANSLAANTYGKAEKLYRTYQLAQSRKYERVEYARFGAVRVVSHVDAAHLHSLNSATNVVVIPNGVALPDRALAANSGNLPEVVFVGKLAKDNLFYLREFLIKAWPVVLRHVPGARLNIVGRIGVGAIALQEEFSGERSIRFRGYVEDLENAYRLAQVAVIPVNKIGGFVNKAIEAMAAGVVPVGFSGAFNGIEGAREGVHFLSAEELSAMGERIVELLLDRGRRLQMLASARELAMTHFSWSSRTRPLAVMYSAAANGRFPERQHQETAANARPG